MMPLEENYGPVVSIGRDLHVGDDVVAFSDGIAIRFSGGKWRQGSAVDGAVLESRFEAEAVFTFAQWRELAERIDRAIALREAQKVVQGLRGPEEGTP